MKRRTLGLLLCLACAACGSSGSSGTDDGPSAVGSAPRIFTMTNATDGNSIVAFAQTQDGHLIETGRIATGGRGVGHGLENQGAATLTSERSYLIAVNPGSADVSVVRLGEGDVRVTDREPSGGGMPVSVAEHNGLVYVLNRDDTDGDSISGFRLQQDGTLVPIPGTTTALSAPATGAAQIALSPDGRYVVVTEQATSRIDVFAVDVDGVAGNRRTFPAAGRGPFGFAFRNPFEFYVSESGTRSASAYELGDDGALRTLSAAVTTGQSATCWLAVTPDAATAFVANTGSQSLSTFAIANDGTLALTAAVAATTDGGPLDLAVTSDGRFLEALTTSGVIEAFRIDATSRTLTRVDGVTGLPTGTNGLVGF
jgi:6-phosphogluconolactonase